MIFEVTQHIDGQFCSLSSSRCCFSSENSATDVPLQVAPRAVCLSILQCIFSVKLPDKPMAAIHLGALKTLCQVHRNTLHTHGPCAHTQQSLCLAQPDDTTTVSAVNLMFVVSASMMWDVFSLLCMGFGPHRQASLRWLVFGCFASCKELLSQNGEYRNSTHTLNTL